MKTLATECIVILVAAGIMSISVGCTEDKTTIELMERQTRALEVIASVMYRNESWKQREEARDGNLKYQKVLLESMERNTSRIAEYKEQGNSEAAKQEEILWEAARKSLEKLKYEFDLLNGL